MIYNNLSVVVVVVVLGVFADVVNSDGGLVSASQLEMFVDEIPDMPRIKAYDVLHSLPVSKTLKISMFQKNWVCYICFYFYLYCYTYTLFACTCSFIVCTIFSSYKLKSLQRLSKMPQLL